MDPTNDSEYRINMRTLIGEGGQFWQDDPEFIKLYNLIHPFSLISPYRCYFIYQFARSANAIEGNFAELGVYRGGSAKLISLVKSDRKKLFLFDTFEGLPAHNPIVDDLQPGYLSETSLHKVKELFNGDNTVQIYPGTFPQTSESIQNEKFAFVYLDADLYKSTHDAISFFFPRMVSGGVILFDDYDWIYCKGVREAIEDYIRENNVKERPIVTTKYQCVIIKS